MGSSIEQYAELECFTHYSFLKGASTPVELIERAHEFGLHSLALTDRNGVYGLPKAYQALKNLKSDLKLICGAEVILEGRGPVTLLAMNRKGYGTLCRLLTALHAGKEKGKGMLRWDEFCSFSSEGLFLLSTLRPDVEMAELSEKYRGQFAVTVQFWLDGFDKQRVSEALRAQGKFGCKVTATQKALYHDFARKPLCDALTCVRETVQIENAGSLLTSNGERVLKSPAQMRRLFREYPDLIRASVEIANLCTFSLSELRYFYPSEWIPKGLTAQAYLEQLVEEGALKRYPSGVPEGVRKQLLHELLLIHQMGFADYFLTIWEIVEFARARDILCQGRGSAANSVVCYVLGITAIDPVRMNLLFERFISTERGEPPDIDVDFENERREEVIQHIYEKYGRDRAAMVSAVVTFQSRLAQREFEKVFRNVAEPKRSEWLERLTEEVQGFPRHLSIHSGGFTLSAEPMIEIVPVEPARMPGRTIIQWDKYDLDIVGLLKVDVLALGMLTALQKTLKMTGIQDLAKIPANDFKTYEMIRKADTIGVFQIESRAQMSMLPRLRPKTFYDLVIELAIVRPGPIVGKMVHPYLRRRQGKEPVEFPDERLRPILEKTLGIPLFQEQVMKIAIVLAGFTGGEADELRRAIGAWRSSGSIHAVGEKLMKGLLAGGLPRSYVEQIFELIKGFSEYGFPESHSASFALLAYASSYLKCHYPAEFTCALLNSQPMGFYSSSSLIEDVRRHGVAVLPVCPHRSGWESQLEVSVEGVKSIRLGFHQVKGVSKKEIEHLISEKRKGAFTGISDFMKRVFLRRDVLTRLALSDFFQSFEKDSRMALWRILGEDSLFSSAQSPSGHQMMLFPEMRGHEKVEADFGAYRASFHGHPVDLLRRLRPEKKFVSLAEVKRASQPFCEASGMVITRQRPSTAKGVCFATLEDESGLLDLILKPEVYEKYRSVFREESFLIVYGKLQRQAEAVSMLVTKVEPLLIVSDAEPAIRSEPGAHDFR